MSEEAASNPPFGIERGSAAILRKYFEQQEGLECVWIYGSRARGDYRARSDIDFAIEAPDWMPNRLRRFEEGLKKLPLVYPIDVTWLQEKLADAFRTRIERDRKLFWEPRRHTTDIETSRMTALKPFQERTLRQLERYVAQLKNQRQKSEKAAETLRVAELDVPEEIMDFPKRAWDALRDAQLLPPAFAARPHSSRFDGAGRPIPNVCFKIPTGGGKTLLAASSVAQVFSSYFGRHTGLVLWVVPNEAIYRQTLKALSHRDHPYRQILNVAGAGRVKILEKNSPLTRLDVESHLCVMLLMLQSAARQSKDTLRFFRDRGNVLGFFPREDDIDAQWELLEKVPNLDVYSPVGVGVDAARAQKGSIVKSSLGNVMRLLRPMVVIDEGHHAYTENALRTLDGFNPGFLLELSATPRVAEAAGSNILVDVRGTDLDDAEMIKLPIHVDVRPWNDWQSCIAAAVQQLDALQREAETLRAETARYIHPILLVQVERTGKDLRDAGFIHAEDARAYLMQLGFGEKQIAIKTSEKDELKQPENIDLLSPTCEVRAIITKQALQEGWDCPFAYVLCALAAGRNPAAMTQLVGRILRQPQVAKTGRDALDACYVLCHDAKTGDVVRGIKRSLETEGMGDLAVRVVSESDGGIAAKPVKLRRRDAFSALRIFLPRVTWVEADGRRRELDYYSEILGAVDWHQLDADRLCGEWAPDATPAGEQKFALDLRILSQKNWDLGGTANPAAPPELDRARIVRSVLDLTPNAWLAWDWVEQVLVQLRARGFDDRRIAASSASLIERLRVGLESERDRLAEELFLRRVTEGRIEFQLRADVADYELPKEQTLTINGKLEPLWRDDGEPIQKSLLEPAYKSTFNDFEAAFACYLDQQAALKWWHRNVARRQYGLQGWRRDKVYPDFVFASLANGAETLVVMETKGTHLQNEDTAYKQKLFEVLNAHYRDRRMAKIGELKLQSGEESVVCDLVFDEAWKGTIADRYFR